METSEAGSEADSAPDGDTNRTAELAAISATKSDLVDALISSCGVEGWTNPNDPARQATWTSIEILCTLLREHKPPQLAGQVIERLLGEKSNAARTGTFTWPWEPYRDTISTLVTADGLRLLIQLGRFEDAQETFQKLQELQHADGGWGAADFDRESRIRATAFVLCSLAEVAALKPLQPACDVQRLFDAADFLISAATKSGLGWGDRPQADAPTLSSTLVCAEALAKLAALREQSPEFLPVLRPTTVRQLEQSIPFILEQGPDYLGRHEVLSLTVPGERYTDFVWEGAGLLAAADLFRCCLSISTPELDVVQPYVASIETLLRRVGPSEDLGDGNWLAQGDDGSDGHRWPSAQAVNIIGDFERNTALGSAFVSVGLLHATPVEQISLRSDPKPKQRSQVSHWWRFFLLAALAGAAAYWLVPLMFAMPDWYDRQRPSVQFALFFAVPVVAGFLSRVTGSHSARLGRRWNLLMRNIARRVGLRGDAEENPEHQEESDG